MIRLSLVVLALASLLRADVPPPFVAGFERFGRTAEIPQTEAGRLLLTELNCTACHRTENAHYRPKLGPRLDGVAIRLRPSWIREYLAAPHEVEPGTTMPDMLAPLEGKAKTDAVNALTAFLATQREPFPELAATGREPFPFEFWNRGNAQRGEDLYHEIGCVACHSPDPKRVGSKKPSELDKLLESLDPDELKELGLAGKARAVKSIPHGDLSKKYTAKALTYFLLEPEFTRPDGRMPNLELTRVEAADLTAYLHRDRKPAPEKARNSEPKLVAKGRALFESLGCANCHSASTQKFGTTRRKAWGLLERDYSKSCFTKPRDGQPYYRLDDAQAKAIRAALESRKAITSRKTMVRSTLLRMNCYGCHERDSLGGVGRHRRAFFETAGQVDLGDEGRLPPLLTNVGAKLKKSWLTKVLDGQGDVRPHMLARMPKFPRPQVGELPRLLELADGASKPPSEKTVFGDTTGLADEGRALMDVGCVQCHPVQGEHLPGVVGVDLAGVADRLHPKWLHDFLANPASLKPGTRMPTFFNEGTSSVEDILDGNVEKQIGAMWVYLKSIDKQPLPQKILDGKSHDFELRPKDRPIILRTFMKEAGPMAIAVGFPRKVHFAFDAEQVRFAVAWRGRFLDAHGTWFDRFAPPAKPLGKAVIRFPSGPPFAVLADEKAKWPDEKGDATEYRFRGYRLDKAGVPTFLYRFGRFDIEDRIAPSDKGDLVRRLRITDRDKSGQPRLWFRAHVGKGSKNDKAMSVTDSSGRRVVIDGRSVGKPILRGGTEWLVPVDIDGEAVLDVRYGW